MEVFVDVWEAQVDELGKVLRLITAGGDPSKSKFYVVFYTIIFYVALILNAVVSPWDL